MELKHAHTRFVQRYAAVKHLVHRLMKLTSLSLRKEKSFFTYVELLLESLALRCDGTGFLFRNASEKCSAPGLDDVGVNEQRQYRPTLWTDFAAPLHPAAESALGPDLN